MPKETAARNHIEFFTLDLNKEPKLPFEDNFFSVVTLLAVVEHLNPDSMAILFRESHRVLKPGGLGDHDHACRLVGWIAQVHGANQPRQRRGDSRTRLCVYSSADWLALWTGWF